MGDLATDANQDGLPVAEALVWLVAGELDGLTHDVAVMPDVPLPEELRSITELLPDDAPDPPSMWLNIEARPVTWSDEPSEPYYASWYRFPAHTSDDAAVPPALRTDYTAGRAGRWPRDSEISFAETRTRPARSGSGRSQGSRARVEMLTAPVAWPVWS
jgi:hypothetical protein